MVDGGELCYEGVWYLWYDMATNDACININGNKESDAVI